MIGEKFSLFNQSGEWEAKIAKIIKGVVEFSITKKIRSNTNEKEIWLAFAPIKLNYLNLMIQKATELGTKVVLKEISKSVLKVIMMAKLEQILNLD